MIGLVTLSRLSLDLFLPSLPQVGVALHASDELVQMTLTSFLFGSAISMILSGQISDLIGKKRVIISSLVIFIIATMISAITSSITILIISRFFQALGGSSGMLFARMMVKEYYSREDQIKTLAYLSFAMALCPLVAPLLGGILQSYYSWRAIFYALGVIGLCLLSTFTLQIKETKTPSNRFSIKELFINYRMLLTHKQFIAYSMAIGCAWCNYSAFSLESPFIFQKILGYSPISYGILVALPTTGYLLGIMLAKKYANIVGWDRLIYFASFICLFGGMSMMVLVSLFLINWLIIILPMIIVMIGVGIIIPCTQGAVMQPFTNIAGTATGLFFFIQMLMGGLCGLCLQFSTHLSAIPLASMILCSSIMLTLSFLLLMPVNFRVHLISSKV